MIYLAVIGFIGIFSSLAYALVAMLRVDAVSAATKNAPLPLLSEEDLTLLATARAKKMATALGLRVALSVSLFLIILLLYALGYIQPTGIILTPKLH